MEHPEVKEHSILIRLVLAIAGLLVFIGVEAIKTFCRKDFAVTQRGMLRFVFCFLAFGGIAAFSFSMINSRESYAIQYGTPQSHLVTGLVYAVTALYILITGMLQFTATRDGSPGLTLNGRSYLLGFLTKDGWKESTIQNLAEPLLLIAIGTALCFYDPYGGVPFIFCGAAVWFMAFINLLFL